MKMKKVSTIKPHFKADFWMLDLHQPSLETAEKSCWLCLSEFDWGCIGWLSFCLSGGEGVALEDWPNIILLLFNSKLSDYLLVCHNFVVFLFGNHYWE
jgi:hypothetical protein